MVSHLKSHFDVQICAESHGDCKQSSTLCKHLRWTSASFKTRATGGRQFNLIPQSLILKSQRKHGAFIPQSKARENLQVTQVNPQ